MDDLKNKVARAGEHEATLDYESIPIVQAAQNLGNEGKGRSYDSVTVLRAKAPNTLTKTFTPKGVQSYSSAKYFTPFSVSVNNLGELSKLLTELATKPQRCIIRGKFKGVEHAQAIDGAVDGPNLFARKKVLYNDPAHRWMLIDVDGYTPSDIDPVQDPVSAIDQFIEKKLPPCFQGKSYHWQLSASAGTPGKTHLLKAHLWFWLKTPYTSAQLNAWAKSVGTAVDSAVYRVVQVHYTADPIFKDGASDPIPASKRHGLEEGWDGDVVDLVIDEVLLLRALEAKDRDEDEDQELVDPRQKKGVIGAFHRVFTVEEVIDRWLMDEFEWEAGSDRRLTWLNGGGTPGGAFVTDDRLHICSTHNTDPLNNIATNLFDVVRVFKYGHLDEGQDDFEILDMQDKPSYQALISELRALPEIEAELQQERVEDQVEARTTRQQLIDQVAAAESEAQLREEVCPVIQAVAVELEKVDLDLLADAIKTRLGSLTGSRVTIAAARDLIRPPRRELERQEGLPWWARPYVFVISRGKLYSYVTGSWLNRETFEFEHNCHAGFDQDGMQLSAYMLLRDSPMTPRVDDIVYAPHLDTTFEMGGRRYVNGYRPSTVPESKPRNLWTAADARAVAMTERHFELLCGGRPAVKQALLDWLAYCVRNPGQKITYSWLIIGGEGAGKTWIYVLMTAVMGAANTRSVSVQEIINPTFNGWAEGSAFASIEEVRIHGHKMDAWDNLKPVLTNPTIPITRKGIDSYNAPNVTNYMMLSNHDDAMPVSAGGRRIAVIRAPFRGDETKKQLDEMAVQEGFEDSAAYFDALFAAVGSHGPALREWLLTWSISPSFNPKGRAPETDEREDTARMSMSVEEEIARAIIEEGRPWVTSKVVNPGRLADAMRSWPDEPIDVSPDKVALILKKLGYVTIPPIRYDGATRRFSVKNLGVTDQDEVRELVKTILKDSERLPGQAEQDFLS